MGEKAKTREENVSKLSYFTKLKQQKKILKKEEEEEEEDPSLIVYWIRYFQHSLW